MTSSLPPVLWCESFTEMGDHKPVSDVLETATVADAIALALTSASGRLHCFSGDGNTGFQVHEVMHGFLALWEKSGVQPFVG